MKWVKINEVRYNDKNPRVIRDDKFAKLKRSIIEFPEMLEKRPLVCVTRDDGKLMVLGGNMRLKALNDIGAAEVPVILADDWSEEQRARFLIADNVGFGEWDWDALANDWDADELKDWGMDLPLMLNEVEPDELTDDAKNNPPMIKITLDNVEQLQQAEIDIQELIDRKYPKAFFSVSAGEI